MSSVVCRTRYNWTLLWLVIHGLPDYFQAGGRKKEKEKIDIYIYTSNEEQPTREEDAVDNVEIGCMPTRQTHLVISIDTIRKRTSSVVLRSCLYWAYV